jgi:hypothetical protein
MEDTKITPEERQRRTEANKLRDYEQAIKTLESQAKALTKERDTLKAALMLSCGGSVGICPYDESCCTYSKAGVCTENMSTTCWRDHFISEAANNTPQGG